MREKALPPLVGLLLGACFFSPLAGCNQRLPSNVATPEAAEQSQNSRADMSTASAAGLGSVPAWLGKPLAGSLDPSKPPVVLFDSFHAHNFLHRGLVPGEHSYHHFTGLRRAAKLLEKRGCEVRELLVGPLTARQLADVQLVVLNLPSTDRPPWLVSEIAAIEQFVRQGGGIIFITDHSNCYYHQYHLLPLWDRLGLTPTFETVCERKDDCKLALTGSGWIVVRDFALHPVTAGVRTFAIQTGGRLAGEGIVAWTSDEAWADAGSVPLYAEGDMGLFGDMRYSDSEEQGKQGIILARGVGLGRVAIVSDQNSLGDAFLSYADNWRLWLSACKWCGQFDWDDACENQAANRSLISEPSNAASAGFDAQSTTENTVHASAINDADNDSGNEAGDGEVNEPTFSELIAGQKDRNAPPAMSPDAWSIHCWEPLAGGRFRWGGTDPEQYYYFWCWMNRWYWATANDRPHRPREHDVGRPMLLAIASDAGTPELTAHAQQTLARGGKVVLLPEADLKTGGEPSKEEAGQTLERAKHLLDSTSLSFENAQWSDKPVPHWRIDTAGGTLIAIANAHSVRNASFSRPEIAPGVAISKWENELRQWLFEQP